ncbi:MAG: primosomal protein N' [Eubacterium sp.]|nr:primosomal protein N' [Eubacterium sp.]
MKPDIAEVIVDISVEELDRPFEYRIPEGLADKVSEGTPVTVPFGRGNRRMTGYVIAIKEDSEWDRDKLKEILETVDKDVPVEGQLLGLAAWIRSRYGPTMNEAIKTVLPIRSKVKERRKKQDVATEKTDTDSNQAKTVRDASTDTDQTDKTSIDKDYPIVLNDEQRQVTDTFINDYRKGKRETYLLYGVTGSGKTEVYMAMLQEVLSQGRQAIVLIPEIALTHQMRERFEALFGDRVSILNSRMSQGERYTQYMRAAKGESDIVIGPRSALFFPFKDPGIIIIDEEHDGSYQSEKTPTYHAKEVAIERARRCGASVVLGSATPSVESYLSAKNGDYKLLTMRNRAGGAEPPKIHVVDLKEELKARNYSIFSELLTEKIRQRLEAGEQTMLFINRRGYAGFVSCRSCGYVIKCDHCDVSMTEHSHGDHPYLICHYCGSKKPMPKTCPECGSSYIAGFGMGTEQVCDLAEKMFPGARVLRMDADTTKNKGGHERVLKPFREKEADILVGTQMIVKGHDMPNVTLVGAIAADLSMHRGDFRSFENTYQLLKQAAGRAGRGDKPGEMVIQTYQPDAYCIDAIKREDDSIFYESELSYRHLGDYPPFMHMLKILISSKDHDKAVSMSEKIASFAAEDEFGDRLEPVGPAPDNPAFIKDMHRISFYIKSEDPHLLDRYMLRIEKEIKGNASARDCFLNYSRSVV